MSISGAERLQDLHMVTPGLLAIRVHHTTDEGTRVHLTTEEAIHVHHMVMVMVIGAIQGILIPVLARAFDYWF